MPPRGLKPDNNNDIKLCTLDYTTCSYRNLILSVSYLSHATKVRQLVVVSSDDLTDLAYVEHTLASLTKIFSRADLIVSSLTSRDPE